MGAAAREGGFRYVSPDAVALKWAKMVVPVVCLWLRLGLWLALLVTVLEGDGSPRGCPGRYGLGGER